MNRVLQLANAEVGYMEKASNKNLNDKTANAGKNNYTKYGEYFGHNGPDALWCQYFQNWLFCQAYGKDTAIKLLCGPLSGYTPTASGNFKKLNRWYSLPLPGDLIYFKNDTRICHVGIVESVKDGKVYTIEGNTSAGSTIIPNGGMVCKKSYDLNNSRIAGYGRPLWDILTPEKTTFQEGWQKGKNDKWWYQYSDGTWPVSEWKLISKRWYYFDDEGYMVTGVYTIGNETFVFCTDTNNNEGAMMMTNNRGALEVWIET